MPLHKFIFIKEKGRGKGDLQHYTDLFAQRGRFKSQKIWRHIGAFNFVIVNYNKKNS
jgi:hypothetical protein